MDRHWTTRRGSKTELCIRCGSPNDSPQRAVCRACRAQEEYERRERTVADPEAENKPCARCGDVPRYRMKSQVSVYCKPCHVLVRREINTRANYGISLEEYDRRMASTGGRCSICQRKAKLVYDHDHATGKHRGPLCQDCNQGLGRFKDEVESLARAITYLTKGVEALSFRS